MRYPSPKGFIGGPWVFVRYPPTGYTLTHVDAEVYMVSKGVCEVQLYPAQDVRASQKIGGHSLYSQDWWLTHFTRKIGGSLTLLERLVAHSLWLSKS